MAFSAIFGVGMPLALTLGGLAAWRVTRTRDQREASKPNWKDDSLDEWRRERDAQAEVERAERAANPERAASASGDESEPVRHQRLGG